MKLAVVRHCVAVIAALLLCVAPGHAGETIPPPDEVRFIDRHGASSDCIGDVSTPLCAVETFLACKVRGDAQICLTALELQARRSEARQVIRIVPQIDREITQADEYDSRKRDDSSSAGKLEESAPTIPAMDRSIVPDPSRVIDATAVEYRLVMQDHLINSDVRIDIVARFHGRDGLKWPFEGWQEIGYLLRLEKNHPQILRIERKGEPGWISEAGSSTDCIGYPIDPVCAVETTLACLVRASGRTCDKTGVPAPRRPALPGRLVRYDIRFLGWQETEPIPPDQRRLLTVETAEIWERLGPPQGEWPTIRPSWPYDDAMERLRNAMTVRYTVERDGKDWRVVSRVERP